ncbi:hypothetical protein JB92DRAFT_2853264 [Gautieria morchelliformis]|nr:hypothetical protein JB92DRAFT_2853264 [Gautieria morchelliformis]
MHAKILDILGDQEFNDMLLSAMLEVRAWALARPVAEQDATGDALADRMEKVKKTEEEQGRSPYLGRHIPTFRTVGYSLSITILPPLVSRLLPGTITYRHFFLLVCTQNKLGCGYSTSSILSSLRWRLLRQVYNYEGFVIIP